MKARKRDVMAQRERIERAHQVGKGKTAPGWRGPIEGGPSQAAAHILFADIKIGQKGGQRQGRNQNTAFVPN